MHLRIEKIGGENSAAIQETLEFIEKNRENGISALYVFSAFRTSEYNTTTELLATIAACQKGDIKISQEKFDQIRIFYRETLERVGLLDASMSVFLDGLFAPYECAIEEFFHSG